MAPDHVWRTLPNRKWVRKSPATQTEEQKPWQEGSEANSPVKPSCVCYCFKMHFGLFCCHFLGVALFVFPQKDTWLVWIFFESILTFDLLEKEIKDDLLLLFLGHLTLFFKKKTYKCRISTQFPLLVTVKGTVRHFGGGARPASRPPSVRAKLRLAGCYQADKTLVLIFHYPIIGQLIDWSDIPFNEKKQINYN